VTDPNESLFLDLNFRTALLESLDWDENQLNSLLQYLQDNLDFVTQTPDDLLISIKNIYNVAAFNIIEKMFIDAYILNIANKPEDGYEH
jgi:hypothetical protein